jgi:hypothetical protein
MPRQVAVTVENNFSGGLITEATGLNFPENACTETYDCEFRLDGSVERRLGFDFEADYSTKTINRTDEAISTYLWKNVAGNGDFTLLVVQVGMVLYFYEVLAEQSYSSGAVASTVTLSPVAGASNSQIIEFQYCDGNGYLIVTHPHCDPVRVSYNTSTHVATGTSITIKIRDFEGAVADPYTISERPTSTLAGLNTSHYYNLLNQGWSVADLTAWDTAQTTMPSNSDVSWSFKDASDNFDASSAAIARVYAGNTPATKGHYVLTLANQDRNTISGLSGVASTTTSFQRPSTSSFFSGRVFYAGINYVGFNSKIYFTQILERVDQYGACYQLNDPTSEDLFNLLPSDGGVISIPEAGTIYKLFTMSSGLVVFAENGVWFVTGSTGIGFQANDYTVQKVAQIPTISASSFVNVAGNPAWWNSKGIYTVAFNNSGSSPQAIPSVQSLTDSKIKTFFDAIPLSSKKKAKGIYHFLDNHIRWIYRSTSTSQITESYEYDRVLNFNLLTGAFYPWTITESDVKVNSIIPSDVISGNIVINNVITGTGDNVQDLSSNDVIVFTSTGSEISPFDKYLVSYPHAGAHNFTFADKINASYLDWFQFDLTENSYLSYFITGYKVRGQGIRKFQNNWVRIFSSISEPVAYYFQGIWDYATQGSGTGRWSSKQLIEHTDTNYSTASKRLKVRGSGLALQFRVESVEQQPFDITGWSALQSGNSSP